MTPAQYFRKLLSEQRSAPSKGEWVVLACPGETVVPVMDDAKPFLMHRYPTWQAALHGARDHSAARQGGGLLLNVKTGRTRAFGPLKREADPVQP